MGVYMKLSCFTGVVSLLLCFSNWSAVADTNGVVWIDAVEDTYITEHVGYGGKSKVQGENVLRILKGIPGLHRTHSLVRFDLEASAGKMVGGDTVEFTVYIRSGWGADKPCQNVGHDSILGDGGVAELTGHELFPDAVCTQWRYNCLK